MTYRNEIDEKSLSVTDSQTDGRMDKAGCRVACTQLKIAATQNLLNCLR